MCPMPRKRSNRVIERLRRKYTHLTWHYLASENIWENDEEGWHIYPCAELAPQYDGDDNTFRTTYFRSDGGRVIELESMATWSLP